MATCGVLMDIVRNFGMRKRVLEWPTRFDQWMIGPLLVILMRIEIMTKGMKNKIPEGIAMDKSKNR